MSRIQLTPARRWRLADVLYGQLLKQITHNEIAEGKRLPSEAEIGKMFGASRPIVRQALMRLQMDGIVYSRKGVGTFVRVRPPERLTEFAEPAAVPSYLRSLEVRVGLETEAARLAATRRSKDQLAAILAAAMTLQKAFEGGEIGQKEDLAFHQAIAQATGNDLFPRLLGDIGDLMRGSMSMGLGLSKARSEARQQQVLNEHQQIADAIKTQDADGAALFMRYHLTHTRQRLTGAPDEA